MTKSKAAQAMPNADRNVRASKLPARTKPAGEGKAAANVGPLTEFTLARRGECEREIIRLQQAIAACDRLLASANPAVPTTRLQ